MRSSTPKTRPAGMDQFLIRETPAASILYSFRRRGWMQDAACPLGSAGPRVRPEDHESDRGKIPQPTAEVVAAGWSCVLPPTGCARRCSTYSPRAIPAALEGTVWIDLYAGTGAVGIEALSRGAGMVYFVESAPDAAELIRKNLLTLGVNSRISKLLRQDAVRALQAWDKSGIKARLCVSGSALSHGRGLRSDADDVFQIQLCCCPRLL